MDASTGGPDSGIDTGSPNFCGFHSPREHTTSETSGADLTDIVSGEEIPFDEGKDSRSFDSSSEFNVWHSTSSHKSPVIGFTNGNQPVNNLLANEPLCTKERTSTLLSNNTLCSEQIVPQFETAASNIQSDIENKNDFKLTEPVVASEITSHVEDYNWQSVMTTNNNTNHYFIDASSLLDDSEIVPLMQTTTVKEVKESASASVTMNASSAGESGKEESNGDQSKATLSPRSKKYTWSDNQNSVAEFEKELLLAAHLEPLTSTRRAQADIGTDVRSVSDHSVLSTDPSNIPSKELVDSFGADLQIVPSASHEELLSADTFTEMPLDSLQKSTDGEDRSPRHSIVEGDVDSPNLDGNIPALVRQKTFELDTDDQHLTLLRQDYERRQGNLLFQSSILQFSTHLVDTGLDSGDMDQGVRSSDLGCGNLGIHSTTDIGSHISGIIPNQSSSRVRPLSTDFFLKENLGNPGTDSTSASNNSLNSHCFPQPITPTNSLTEVNSMNMEGNVGGKDINNSREESMLMRSSDISSKPILSGALCHSDILTAAEQASTDSPKRQRRIESTPILSGGVSCKDFVPFDRVSESPIMSRRKNEFAPILSGAAPAVEPEPVVRKTVAPAGLTSAWVVDMGDCSTTKGPTAGRRKSEGTVISGSLKAVEINSEGTPSPKTAPLGFFIDLSDVPKEAKPKVVKEKVGAVNTGISSEMGFYVDFSNDTNADGGKPTSKRGGKESAEETPPVKPSSKNACGFFIDLSSLESPKKEVPVKRTVKEETDDNANKKNTLFSMFIDISDASSSKTTSLSDPKNKVSASPQLSTHRKLKPDKLPVGILKQDSEKSVKALSPRSTCDPEHNKLNIKQSNSTADCTNPNIVLHASHQSNEAKELEEEKKQGVDMYVEPESPIARRKTLPSGMRPSVNRHSWNPEARNAAHPVEEHRRKHKRAHSLSVDCKLVAATGDEKTSSSTSLSKSRTRGSSQSLQEATSPEQTSLTQFSDLSSRQISSSSYSRPPSKTYDKLSKRLSYEGKTDSERDLSDLYSDTISEGKMINEEESQVTDVEMVDDSQDIEPSDPKCKFTEAFDLSVSQSSIREESLQDQSMDTLSPSKSDVPKQISSEIKVDAVAAKIQEKNKLPGIVNDVMPKSQKKSKERKQTSVEVDVIPKINETEPKIKTSLKEVAEKNLNLVAETREKEETSLECFVKLSDMDKEPVREESGVILPSFATSNRMTRSIPETSWIESKLAMTRSIGGGTTSRSLSRLFPHLHSTMMSVSAGSLPRSRSPGETDEQSEVSDISSMQSSMAASGMEGSTEETDTSLSRGPASRLGEDLLRMFLEEISPDVTVDVGGRRIKAHKCILSSRCQYFAAVLSGGWVQSAGDVISLQGFSYNAVFFALCHIYSGTNNIPDTISVVELATLADMLALEGLKEVIMFTLKSKYCHFFHKPCTMCAVGVLECLPLAAAYGLDDIYRKSLRWITKHFVRIWPTKGFATLPRELIDKCYQQHVVHMMPDNILETVMCCDKLLATLPSVRWAEPVFAVTSQLLDSSIRFTAHNFSSVLDSRSFVSLSKELSWNISRLEESLTLATERLPPDQACLSYNRLHQMLDAAQNNPDIPPSPSFLELLRRLEAHTEDSLVRLAPRACRCPSWAAMDPALRKHIQEVACLVIAPSDEALRAAQRVSRHSNQSQARSISGSRNLDLRQVKLAMTQQARRAASGGRVSTLRADTKPPKKSQPIAVIHPHRFEQNAKDVISEESVPTNKPKAWQLQVFETNTRSSRQRAGDVNNESSASEKTPAVRRKMISSSDSSRTSSPAMRRAAVRSERAAKQTINTASRLGDRPESSELRHRRKEAVVNMSNDSLTENVVEKQTASKCSASVRPDAPPARRKRVEASKVIPAEIKVDTVGNKREVSSTISSISTVKRQLGRVGDDAAMSSDSLATEGSYTIDDSKSELRLNLPKSPLVGRADLKGESKVSPGNAKRSTRAPLISPRESNTSRLRSAAAAASLHATHTNKNTSLTTKSPTDTASPNRNNRGKITATKSVKVEVITKTTSPGNSVGAKRTPTRFLSKQSVASPVKLAPPVKTKTVARLPSKESESPKSKTLANKVNATTQIIQNGTPDKARNKLIKNAEIPAAKVLGSRSGTFLKDEPTVLKKPSIENVQE